jgi:TPR repeat protein
MELISMKWTRLITLSLAALLTVSSMASKFDDRLKAAEQGSSNAQYNLGFMYEKGQGTPQDYKKAVKWYKKSAEQGYANAYVNIGSLYFYGRGVIQSKKRAYIWWSIAALNGNSTGINNRDLVAKQLSPRGLEEAQEEAGKLYEKMNNAKNQP